MSEKQTCPRRMNEMGPWRYEENLDSWVNDRCSFCGSLHPDKFFESIDKGKSLTPTDKNYKVYIENYQKFYFQHLNEEEQFKFIKLYNEKKLKIDYPGYFYVLPFFVKGIK